MKVKERMAHGFVFLAFVLTLMFAVYPVRAQAASYKVATKDAAKKDRKAGNTVFDWKNSSRTLYATTNGKKVKLYSAPTGYYVGATVVSNGSAVYFTAQNDNGSKCMFYSCTVSGKNLKKLATGKWRGVGWPILITYYKNKLYFRDGWSGGYLRSLDVKTGKIKKLSAKAAVTTSCSGKYIFFTYISSVYSYNMI